jgi:long-chain fatty acid transport protein
MCRNLVVLWHIESGKENGVKMRNGALVFLATATAAYGGGYKIPESSLNAVALSAANVAYAHGADAAYYNPANMVWAEDMHTLEADLTYIYLSKVKYVPVSGDTITSEAENFLIPTLHYVSPGLNGFRFGLSIVTPAGLSKRWHEQPGKTYAHEFTLETVEVNPSVAVALGEKVSVAAGARLLYSSGVVKSASTASRDMSGKSVDYGYNLALSYRPAPAWKMAVTYRSKIDMNVEGDATLYFPDNADYSGTIVYDGEASVTVPLPAALSLAAAYTFGEKTTVEFVYERTFWSVYESLDFDYASSIGVLSPVFDEEVAKDWVDTNTYRLGVNYMQGKWTAMAGAVYDETPIPEKTLNFETPDSDAISFSLGGRYRIDETWEIGLAGLYSIRDERSATNDNIDGTFRDSRVYLLTAGVEYRF